MIELKATKDHLLTNGVIYSEAVYLSDLDSPDDWTEVTKEEAEAEQAEAEEPMLI